MRTGTKVTIAAALGFAAGVGMTVWMERLYAADGFLKNTVDTAFRAPYTPTKYLLMLAMLLPFLALPFGIVEWRAERRYLRQERALRAARPGDAVTAYDGPEGRGVLFDGPSGRTLLLEPAGGWGEPRLVELPPVPPSPPENGLPAEQPTT